MNSSDFLPEKLKKKKKKKKKKTVCLYWITTFKFKVYFNIWDMLEYIVSIT
jgi:hypothetical protein